MPGDGQVVSAEAPARGLSGFILIQVLTLTLGFAAAAWGVLGVYGAAFPGPCGDNMGPGLGVIESWVLDVPVGILLLLVWWLIKRGSGWLRKFCLVGVVLLVALPVTASVFLQRWHCP